MRCYPSYLLSRVTGSVNQKSKEMETTTDYQKQALDFLNDTNTSLTVKYKAYGKHFAGDKENRHIFRCRLANDLGSYNFDFGQSIASGSTPPTAYDILACLQKYDVGSFEDFCGDFGYDTDSRTAERTYKAVCKEFEAIDKLFTSEQIEQLQEIR